MKPVVIDRMINMIEAKTHHEPLENVTHNHIRFQVIPRGSTGNFSAQQHEATDQNEATPVNSRSEARRQGFPCTTSICDGGISAPVRLA